MNRKMIKGFAIVSLIGICMVGWSFLVEAIAGKQINEAYPELIRLHVLANSDSPADQKLKLMVRDALIEYLEPQIRGLQDQAQVKALVLNQKAILTKIATETLLKQGTYYPVDIEYGVFDFPIKSYGELVVPSGRYEAVRVLIGNAEGANWWCVLFPPLCFVDESKVVSDIQSENDENNTIQVEQKLMIRYKIVELLQSL